MPRPLIAMAGWSRRHWVTAALAALVTVLVVGIPSAMIPTPLFGRSVPVTPWSWPVLAVTGLLSGLIVATYVRDHDTSAEPDPLSRRGTVGGLLAFFAVGCPVCNKVVLLALGSTGAMQWFAPVQPFLAVAGMMLLSWALVVRLRGQVACPTPPAENPVSSSIAG
ncbi:hypothetical protein SAMN05421595_1276 [Austwickia chelonae]|nr:hypothetical protein [Austwickia chelonae]SEW10503.1 hypothetical protein SAMN05421595_1276 [Austwickia chelonae]